MLQTWYTYPAFKKVSIFTIFPFFTNFAKNPLPRPVMFVRPSVRMPASLHCWIHLNQIWKTLTLMSQRHAIIWKTLTFRSQRHAIFSFISKFRTITFKWNSVIFCKYRMGTKFTYIWFSEVLNPIELLQNYTAQYWKCLQKKHDEWFLFIYLFLLPF